MLQMRIAARPYIHKIHPAQKADMEKYGLRLSRRFHHPHTSKNNPTGAETILHFGKKWP